MAKYRYSLRINNDGGVSIGIVSGMYSRPKSYQIESYLNKQIAKFFCVPLVTPSLIIYAPPHTGKSTFMNEMHNKFCTCSIHEMNSSIQYVSHQYTMIDTDYSSFGDFNIVITNRHNFLHLGDKSVAIVPDKRTFLDRCKLRGLEPAESWYDDMLGNVSACDYTIKSNKYVGELLAFLQL